MWQVDGADQFASGYVGMGNNAVNGIDPDGQWVQYAIGAVLGGFSGYKIGKSQGAKGLQLAGYIFGGAAIGAISAGAGEAVLGSFSYAAQAGVSAGSSALAYGAAGAASGFVGGAGMAGLSGGDVWQGGLNGALWGAATGAVGGYLQHTAFESAMFDINHMSAGGGGSTYWGGTLGEVVIRAPRTVAWPRVGVSGLSVALSRVSGFLAFASLFEGDVSQTQRKSNYIQMYRNMGEAEYNSFMRKGGNFGYGVNTLDYSKQFWMTPEGLANWNKTILSGPFK